MFEPATYSQPVAPNAPTQPAEPYSVVAGIKRTSLLVWGEHCIECAAPDCYQTCELYAPRPDGRCRRFEFGVYRNYQFKSRHGYGAEVQFKKWAKLEARGNTRLESPRLVRLKERLIALASPILGLLGSVVARLKGDARWRYVTHALLERVMRWVHRRRHHGVPDAFLLEVYNPGPACDLRLNMSLFREAGPLPEPLEKRVPPFVRRLTCRTGFNRHVIEREAFAHVTECGRPFDVSLTPEAESAARLIFLSADFVTLADPVVSTAPAPASRGVKCVIWDLDNTLWKGILLENDDVAVPDAVVRLVFELDSRGIVNSIASKNDHAHAWEKLVQFGLAELFVYPRINWAPKSHNIKQIAKQLNIDLDTLAFIDDNSFELEQVRQALPGVLCVPVEQVGELASHPRFAGSQTAEAKHRRGFYQAAMAREEQQAAFDGDYLSFLKSCNLALDILPFHDQDLERVVELIQRTNQLNFSGRKYTRQQTEAMLAEQGVEQYILKAEDRFGTYGIVGFARIERSPTEVVVGEFMLSCRVQGKCIEQAFFYYVTETKRFGAAQRLVVRFCPTARNTPARQLLDSLGFLVAAAGEPMTLALPCAKLATDVVTVRGVHAVGAGSSGTVQ